MTSLINHCKGGDSYPGFSSLQQLTIASVDLDRMLSLAYYGPLDGLSKNISLLIPPRRNVNQRERREPNSKQRRQFGRPALCS